MRNIHSLTLLVLSLCISNLNGQQVFFVKENGQGNGSSWRDAAGNLQAVLNKSNFGDQIWVAKGTYFPEGPHRESCFEIKDGVQLLGGFGGSEDNAAKRNPAVFKTILSGEIGKPGNLDNCYNVILTRHVSEKTVVDGFTITGGNADGVGPNASRQRCGGGWYNDGSKGVSNPTVVNCIFIENQARDGAGMYNNGRTGEASPRLSNCIFIKNNADLDGGGLYNDGRNKGKSNPELTACILEGNHANYGGGMFNYGGGGMSSPTLKNCQIIKNLAYVRGGALLNMDFGGISLANIEACSITDNEASVGEGIYQFSSVNGSGIKSLTDQSKLK